MRTKLQSWSSFSFAVRKKYNWDYSLIVDYGCEDGRISGELGNDFVVNRIHLGSLV